MEPLKKAEEIKDEENKDASIYFNDKNEIFISKLESKRI